MLFPTAALTVLSFVLLPLMVFADPAPAPTTTATATPVPTPDPVPAPAPAPPNNSSSGYYGRTVAVLNQRDFCLFLPRYYGGEIGPSESTAVAFCTRRLAAAPYSRILPKYFIRSAHYIRNFHKGYVQVTGRMDRTKYGLSRHDEGGQYDPHAPRWSKCTGYNYFVSLVEPNDNIYCIRCCRSKYDCPVNKSELGCRRIIRGNYS